MPRREPLAPFDPERYRSDLVAIIRAIEALPDDGTTLGVAELDPILRRHPRDGTGFFSRSQLIAGFRALASSEGFRLDEAAFGQRVRLRRVRSLSGVTPVTVLTRPFPCPGQCIFCPNDVRMPKSYLADEPGAQRAANNHFDPYLQTWSRLATYRAIGHPTDKVELIVLGGTWSFHPEPYQRWFVTRLFEALNDFGAGLDRRSAVEVRTSAFDALPARLDGRRHEPDRYNRMVRSVLRGEDATAAASATEATSWADLERAQTVNETAISRCVGLVVETRPDHISLEEVARIRRLGATKVQIGIQSLDDSVLAANGRGHDVEATHRALRLLRGAGFKIHAHWMPNLLGSTPAADIADFERLFDDPRVKPDELKVYPCSLVESAELVQYYERGDWRPYSHDELLEVIVAALGRAPRWTRLTRVIRDISSDDIVVGNKLTNFREIAAAELERRGQPARDIRAREVRDGPIDLEQLVLRVSRYEVATGNEHFLELVTPDDRIAGFLRLFLPTGGTGDPSETDERGEIGEVGWPGARVRALAPETLDEVAGCALIRELHVYGQATPVGTAGAGNAQHRGLGRRLLEEACGRAHAAGYPEVAVISAVGTREYYRKNGFADGQLYQKRASGPLCGER